LQPFFLISKSFIYLFSNKILKASGDNRAISGDDVEKWLEKSLKREGIRPEGCVYEVLRMY